MTSQFPDITSVDPSDATSMAALAHLLFSTYKLEGGFDNSIDPSMFRRLRESAEKWVFEVEKNIEGKDASQMQAYLSMYELMHSLAFSKTNSKNGFYDRFMDEAIMKMAKGEKADKVMFMNWIQNRLRQDYRKVSENQFVWFTSVLSRWEEEFKVGVNAFSRESNSETLGIIDFLLKNSLNGKVNGKLPVDKLLKSGLTLTDKTMVNPDANPRQLIDAATFILTLYIADTDHEYQHKRKNLLTRLSETPGIHPLSRQAYRLDSLYEFPSE